MKYVASLKNYVPLDGGLDFSTVDAYDVKAELASGLGSGTIEDVLIESSRRIC